MPLSVACAIWPEEILTVLSGVRWVPAAGSLRILSLYVVIAPAFSELTGAHDGNRGLEATSMDGNPSVGRPRAWDRWPNASRWQVPALPQYWRCWLRSYSFLKRRGAALDPVLVAELMLLPSLRC